MDKKLLFTTFFLIFSAFTFAQNGKIQGVVSDGITGESLIGVNIMTLQVKELLLMLMENLSLICPMVIMS